MNEIAVNIADELRLAIGLHQRGQLKEAQAIYERILRINPSHGDALHLLGVVAYQQRQFGKAVELIDRAIAVSPANPVLCAKLTEGRPGGSRDPRPRIRLLATRQFP